MGEAERLLMERARGQRGLLARAHVLEAGCSDRMISARLHSGRWTRMHRGVYHVNGAPVDERVKLLAATFSRVDAVASHESAAELHGLAHVARGRVIITAANGARTPSPSVTLHQTRRLSNAHRTVIDGVPCTGKVRTIVDLAEVLSEPVLRLVIEDACVADRSLFERLVSSVEVLACGRRGRHRLGRVLADLGDGTALPESELERAFLSLVKGAGMAVPRAQVTLPWLPVAGGRVDFAYPDERLVVELDGRRWHGRDSRREADLRRDHSAALAGWRVLRFSWHQVRHEPDYVLGVLRQALVSQAVAA